MDRPLSLAKSLLLVGVVGVVLFLGSLSITFAKSEKRVALVIGNSAYEYVSKLPNPANDAEDIAAALTRLSFSVTAAKNLDYNQMRIAIRDFGDAAAKADIALVYFAGHGIEIENTNYLIPVNAELKSDRDVEFEAIRLDAVIGALDASKGVKIVLIDACRNNPFLSSMTMTTATRSVGRGLARIDSGGVMVGYSARGGTVSLDGDGRNSPYAQAVLKHLDEPGLELGKMFRRIRDSVLEETDGQQEPYTYGSLPGEDIFLVPPVQEASLIEPTPQAPRVAVAPEKPASSEPSPEEKLFNAARDVNTLRGWAIYFRQFPSGTHHDEAIALEAKQVELTIWTVIANRKRVPPLTLIAKPLDLSLVDPVVASEVEEWIGVTERDRMTAQDHLRSMGFYSGPVDGDFGPVSRAAIRSLQSASHIAATGILTRATAAALGLQLYLYPASFSPTKSTTLAVNYRTTSLRDLGEDKRLIEALDRYLGGKAIIYGVFQGHIYIAVRYDAVHFLGNLQDSFTSFGGHLVSITSTEENDFVVDLIRRDPGFWNPYKKEWVSGPMIGLMQKPGSREPGGGWEWVTGEPVKFLNWARDMPNNNEGRASIGAFGFQHPDGPGRGKSDWWRWDDYVNTQSSYVVEIE